MNYDVCNSQNENTKFIAPSICCLLPGYHIGKGGVVDIIIVTRLYTVASDVCVCLTVKKLDLDLSQKMSYQLLHDPPPFDTV